jgi:hypothetical protein
LKLLPVPACEVSRFIRRLELGWRVTCTIGLVAVHSFVSWSTSRLALLAEPPGLYSGSIVTVLVINTYRLSHKPIAFPCFIRIWGLHSKKREVFFGELWPVSHPFSCIFTMRDQLARTTGGSVDYDNSDWQLNRSNLLHHQSRAQ